MDTKLYLKIVSLIACTRNEKYILPVSLCAWIIPSFLFLSISVCIDVQDVYVFMNSIHEQLYEGTGRCRKQGTPARHLNTLIEALGITSPYTRDLPKNANNDLLNYMTYAYLTPTGDEEIDYVYASRGKVSVKCPNNSIHMHVNQHFYSAPSMRVHRVIEFTCKHNLCVYRVKRFI